MAVYLIAEVRVTDDRWVPAYAASVHDLVHKHGGRYLARSGRTRALEGKPHEATLVALMAFPSAKQLDAFVEDPEYAPFAASRRRGSESHFRAIDDTDIAGTIDYLPKAAGGTPA